jgi:monoamine oxidase
MADQPGSATAAAARASVEVVVVGAGIAGLSVARCLVAAGRSVAVLESRDRIGGRLRSHGSTGNPARVDLGATWFWPGEARVAALVEELSVPTHPQHLDGDAMYQDLAGPTRLRGNPIDVPSFRFTRGSRALAEAVADSLPPSTVRLGSRVATIGGPGPLIVEHDGGSIEAEHVVLALPPALAVARIEFRPPLPDRLRGLAATTPVWMGSTTKVVALYDRPFWRDAGLSGSAISHVGPMRELHDMSGPDGDPAALFGFVPNTAAGSTPSAETLLGQLADIFGPRAAEPTELIVTDWRREPDTSPPGVERLTDYRTFGHPDYQAPALGGRLHWASTETAPVAPGHIEGALAAADRAVTAIVHGPIAAQHGSRR